MVVASAATSAVTPTAVRTPHTTSSTTPSGSPHDASSNQLVATTNNDVLTRPTTRLASAFPPITELGGIGATPIINYPEVAILGVGRARQVPVVRDGQIVPRLVLPLSLAFDHRVIDGMEAARFSTDLVGLLEAPERLFLEG